MSHHATSWAIRQRGLRPAAKIVLWHLCDRYHPDHGCFPSLAQLADDCEMSIRSVQQQIAALEAAGLVRVGKMSRQHGHMPRNRYFLAFEDGFQDAAASNAGSREDVGRTMSDQSEHVDIVRLFWPVWPDRQNGAAPELSPPEHDQEAPPEPPETAAETASDEPSANPANGSPEHVPMAKSCNGLWQNLPTNLVREEPVREPVRSARVRARARTAETAENSRSSQGEAPSSARPRKATADDDIRDTLCAVISADIADAFIAHRKAKRAPLTAHAARLIARRLEGRPNANDIVEQSIINGWTGIFPDSVRPPLPPRQPDIAAIMERIGQRTRTWTQSRRS